jgi:hypothetical protein
MGRGTVSVRAMHAVKTASRGLEPYNFASIASFSSLLFQRRPEMRVKMGTEAEF